MIETKNARIRFNSTCIFDLTYEINDKGDGVLYVTLSNETTGEIITKKIVMKKAGAK